MQPASSCSVLPTDGRPDERETMSVDVDSLPVFRFFLPCSRLHAVFCLAHEIFYASFLFVSVSVVVIVALVTPIHDFVTFRT